MSVTAEQRTRHRQELGRLVEVARGLRPLDEPLIPNESAIEKAPWWRRVAFTMAARRNEAAFYKAFVRQIGELGSEFLEPEEQGSKVNMAFDLLYANDSASGVREKTNLSFGQLRAMLQSCEPANAIVDTLINLAASFWRLPVEEGGYVSTPGFRVRMRIKSEEATEDDRKKMSEYEEVMLNAGYCQPPLANRPEGWQPGGEAWLRAFLRDSLTMDWCATRFNRADPSVDPEGKYPIVSWCAWDAARVRRVRRKTTGIADGVVQSENWQGQRTNYTEEETVFVEVDNDGAGGLITDEYKAREMKVGVRNPRTDTEGNGYGYAELERCINAISCWIYARDYNTSRFRLDTLPRGILTIMGQMSEPQFQMFKLEWRQLLQGLGKRWTIPILRGKPEAGSAVNWLALDQNSRDMEYHQFMFSVSLWLHAAFRVHPEETGYEALSPFRPPLSESSPETKLEYSQDKGLHPLMNWLANWINENILWVMCPDRRYVFEWVGTGDYDLLQQLQVWSGQLQAGLATPAEVWAKMDKPIPDLWKGHPAWDTPMPFSLAVQYWDNLHQMEQQAQMQQQMADQQQMMAQSGMAPGGPGGSAAPPGGPPGAGGAPGGMPMPQAAPPGGMGLPPTSPAGGGGMPQLPAMEGGMSKGLFVLTGGKRPTRRRRY